MIFNYIMIFVLKGGGGGDLDFEKKSGYLKYRLCLVR